MANGKYGSGSSLSRLTPTAMGGFVVNGSKPMGKQKHQGLWLISVLFYYSYCFFCYLELEFVFGATRNQFFIVSMIFLSFNVKRSGVCR